MHCLCKPLSAYLHYMRIFQTWKLFQLKIQNLKSPPACPSRGAAETLGCGPTDGTFTSSSTRCKAVDSYLIRELLEKQAGEFLPHQTCQCQFTIGRVVEGLVFPREIEPSYFSQEGDAIGHCTTVINHSGPAAGKNKHAQRKANERNDLECDFCKINRKIHENKKSWAMFSTSDIPSRDELAPGKKLLLLERSNRSRCATTITGGNSMKIHIGIARWRYIDHRLPRPCFKWGNKLNQRFLFSWVLHRNM